MTHLRLIALVALCATMVAGGCARRAQPAARVEPPPAPVVQEPPPPPPALPPAPAPAASLAAPTDEEIFARKTLAELNAERPLGDVFFDLDQFADPGRRARRPAEQRPVAPALDIDPHHH